MNLQTELSPGKKWMEKIRYAEKTTKQAYQRIKTLRILAGDITVQLSDMPKNPSPEQEKMALRVIRILEAEEHLKGLIAYKQDLLDTLKAAIDEIEDTEIQGVLALHLVKNMSLYTVGLELNISPSTVNRRLRDGYAELDKLLPTNVPEFQPSTA